MLYSEADIININESHLQGEDEIFIDQYKWFGNNRLTRHVRAPTASGGVGMLVNQDLIKEYQVEIIDKYEGILGLKFTHKISEFEFVVFSCYLPPENSPWGRDATSFFNHLLQQMYLNCNVDALFLVGDFNARVGNLKDFECNFQCLENRMNNVDQVINNHGRE